MAVDDWILEDLQEIRDISLNVDDYISNGVYISNYGPDDYTMLDLLKDAYGIILGELQELGINVVIDELMGDYYSLKLLYYLRKVLDADHFTNYLKDEEFKNRLENLLNNPETEDVLISTIELLSSHYANDEDIKSVMGYLQFCTSSDRFNKHINSIMDDTPDHSYSFDIERANAYIQKIEIGRKAFAKAVDILFSKIPNLNTNYLLKIIETYDLDKVAAAEIKYYSLFDTEEELPVVVERMAAKWMDKHHLNSSHHIEYWMSQDTIRPTNEDLIALVCHHYEHPFTKASMLPKVQNMITIGKDLFTKDQIAFMNDCVNLLFDEVR